MQKSIELNLFQFLRVFKSKNPRLAFFSDNELFNISSFINKPKEILKKITTCFPGLKDLNSEEKTVKNQIFLEIIGFETFYNENLFLKQAIKLEIHNKYEVYFFDLVNKIEESMKEYLKNNIWKSLQTLIKSSLDYINLFKSLTNKQTFFQSLYLINDILFFYEITHLFKLSEKKNLNFERQITIFKAKIMENFVNFRNFFVNQITLSVSKALQSAFIQFSMQILSHINILDFLQDSHIQEIASFEYLIIPKFSIELPRNLLKNSSVSEFIEENMKYQKFNEESDNYSGNSLFFNNLLKLYPNELKISLLAMNYKVEYGFEIVKKFSTGAVFETTFRSLICLMSAVTSYSGLALRGLDGVGKKTTVENLGIMLAKPMFFIGFFRLFFTII